MTWLDFKRKMRDVTSRMTTEDVPITFLYGDAEIHPDDITVECEVAGDSLALVVDLKERK